MKIHDIKHHDCPWDNEEGTLLVDLDTESMPVTDEDGNVLYYCENGHTFAVDDDKSDYYSNWKR
jgi:hypothetical protein